MYIICLNSLKLSTTHAMPTSAHDDEICGPCEPCEPSWISYLSDDGYDDDYDDDDDTYDLIWFLRW